MLACCCRRTRGSTTSAAKAPRPRDSSFLTLAPSILISLCSIASSTVASARATPAPPPLSSQSFLSGPIDPCNPGPAICRARGFILDDLPRAFSMLKRM